MKPVLPLLSGIALAALAAACTTTGLGLPGLGDASGCRTVYVYRGGGIQPVSNCGGSAVPRDELRTKSVQPQALASLEEGQPPVLQDANAPAPVTPISLAAKETQPAEPPKDGYPGANEMLENADMSAFMARVRTDFSKKENAGAWGYMIIDAMAADDAAAATTVLNAMAERPPPEMLSAIHLRPWVFAASDRKAEAMVEMGKARRIIPAATLLGHRALLAEGMGDTAGALAVYEEAPDRLNPPKPDEVTSPDYLARAMAFNSQRLLILRQAELLRAVNRNPEAIDLLTKLLAASPDDAYVRLRLERARANTDARPARTLKQAMAVAISDEADIVEERQALMGMMMGRGGKMPFNHLLSSLRQSALLLDPDNGDIRLGEVGALYQNGKFEPALRIAQIGNPPKAQAAALWSTAGLAALELGSPDTLVAMTDRALAIDSSPEAKIQAAGALTNGGKTDKALQLIDQALRGGLNQDQQVFAQMSKGQAQLQAGNVAGAVEAARAARRLKDDDNSKQFLASMLVEQKGTARAEGIELMQGMLADAPDNTGLMNNLGYCLVDDYASDAELEEGFKLLKRAIRITPDEPNLLDSIGWAYYQYGDFREAKRYIGLALDAYEPFDHWELSDHMGDVHWRLGEQEDARKAWQHSLDSYPPAHNKAAIEAKLKEGLKTPAPVRRDTPEVPLSRDRNGVSDI
jgi:tetratricopeptide (TPR) repeat protein